MPCIADGSKYAIQYKQCKKKNKMATGRVPLNQRVRSVRLFSVTNNLQEVHRRMKAEFGPSAPKPKTIASINKKFDVTGSVVDLPRSGRPNTVNTEENKERLMETLLSSPEKSKSARRLSSHLHISDRTVRRMLKELKLRPYHPRLINSLMEDDPDRRLQFAEMWLAKLEAEPELEQNVLWTDEAKFHLSGSVNRHNCVYWRHDNPNVVLPYDDKSPGVMVWGGVTFDGLIGPFFFDGNVTGETYLELIKDTVYPLLQQKENFNYLWWQQDGAPPHFALIVRAWLDQAFPQRWIGRRVPLEWPARSPDLTPPDFFLWGYLKDKVYAHRMETLEDLKDAITEEFQAVPNVFCQKACENVSLRLQACIDNDGMPVDHYMENRH